MHFKAFARSLEEQGVDLKKVNISKSVRYFLCCNCNVPLW